MPGDRNLPTREAVFRWLYAIVVREAIAILAVALHVVRGGGS